MQTSLKTAKIRILLVDDHIVVRQVKNKVTVQNLTGAKLPPVFSFPAAKAGKAGTPHSRAAKAGTAASHRPPTASRSVATTSGSHVTSTTAGTAAGQSAPPVSSPVATTSASGVTTITTTNPVTGKKTVTKVRRGGRGGDD